MEKLERERALRYLAQSREMLIQAVDGLSPTQQSFRPAPDRWSVADCVEHVTVVESNILNAIHRNLQQPPGISRIRTAKIKWSLIMCRAVLRV